MDICCPEASSIRFTSATPRILFADQTARLGGAERVLCNAVGEMAANPTVFLFEDGPLRDLLESAGVTTRIATSRTELQKVHRDRGMLHALPMTAALLRLGRELASVAREHDLVVANSQKAFVVAALAACIVRRPLIWWLHDILSDRHFGRSQIRLGVMLANHLTKRVMVPSRAVRDAFVQAGGRSALVTVVPNGVPIPVLDADKSVTREALGLEPGFTVGVFSRIAPWKGQHVVLNAVARLTDVRCIIAGAPQFGEDEYLSRLRDLADTLHIADRVRFLGHCNNVEEFMRAVDVLVHPSVEPEPFGLTLIEAMLQETPIIAADDGAAREILCDGTLGVLVPPGDAGALASALLRIRAESERATAVSRVARQSAEQRFAAAEMRRNLLKVVHGVMAAA